jgi:hypothetical protein
VVDILAQPEVDAILNYNLVQGSGASQSNGSIQNGAVIGQPVPSVISSDPNGNVQTGSGFVPPIPCTDCKVVF